MFINLDLIIHRRFGWLYQQFLSWQLDNLAVAQSLADVGLVEAD